MTGASDIISRAAAAALMVALLCAPVSAQETSSPPSPSRPGPTIPGTQSIDPTENVKALSEAANKRQDDLRVAAEKLDELRVQHIKELLDERTRRIDDNEKLRAEYSDRLAAAEAKRIDAIRLVDVGAAANLATRTTEQATALATVVNQSAEVLRNQVSRAAEDTRALVATTAATQLQNQQQQFSVVTTRLSALEQAGAEGLGKQKFQDPALAALVVEVQKLSQSRADLAGTSTGRSDVMGWIQAALMLLFAGGAFFVTRWPVRRR